MIAFNADEILEMAEQIERNGARFYRKAAGLEALSGNKGLLLDLADKEDEHERIFVSMRTELSEKEREAQVFDPDNELALYLQAMADGYVFDVKTNPEDELKGSETLEDVLTLAIGKEKDSIVFYLGIKDMNSTRLGKDRIDNIIKEEMRHVSQLSQELANSKKK